MAKTSHTYQFTLLATFLSLLEGKGKSLPVDQHLRVQELLNQLPAGTSPELVRDLIVPILATNPDTQEELYQLFEQAQKMVDANPAISKNKKEQQRKQIQKWGLILLGTAPIFMLLLFLFSIGIRVEKAPESIQLQLYPSQGDTIDLKKNIITNFNGPRSWAPKLQFIPFKNTFLENGALLPLAVADHTELEKPLGTLRIQEGYLLSYQANDIPGRDTLYLEAKGRFIHYPEIRVLIDIPDTSQVTVPDVAFKDLPDVVEPQNPYYVSNGQTDFGLKARTIPHQTNLSDLKYSPSGFKRFLMRWEWPIKIFLVLFFAWALYHLLAYRDKRRQKMTVSDDAVKDKPPYIWNIHLPDMEGMIGLGDQFRTIAAQLRQRTIGEVQRLSIPKTIQATIQQAGMINFQYQYLTRAPEYLILIDKKAARSHQAALFDAVFQAFIKEEVTAQRFFYRGDPRIIFNEDYPKGVALKNLQAKLPETRLILIGNGYYFLNRRNGKLNKWAATLLGDWKEKVLFTTQASQEWGRKERILKQALPLLPAQIDSIPFMVEQFNAGEEGEFSKWRKYIPEAHPNSIRLEGGLMPTLKRHYDPEMLRWIAACAVYPSLHWDLTLYLGQWLSSEEHSLLSVENLRQLNRLPWFVEGQMPSAVRTGLMEWLKKNDPELLNNIRLELVHVLQDNYPPEDSAAWDPYRLNLAMTEWMVSQDKKQKEKLQKEIEELFRRGNDIQFNTIQFAKAELEEFEFELPEEWQKKIRQGKITAPDPDPLWKRASGELRTYFRDSGSFLDMYRRIGKSTREFIDVYTGYWFLMVIAVMSIRPFQTEKSQLAPYYFPEEAFEVDTLIIPDINDYYLNKLRGQIGEVSETKLELETAKPPHFIYRKVDDLKGNSLNVFHTELGFLGNFPIEDRSGSWLQTLSYDHREDSFLLIEKNSSPNEEKEVVSFLFEATTLSPIQNNYWNNGRLNTWNAKVLNTNDVLGIEKVLDDDGSIVNIGIFQYQLHMGSKNTEQPISVDEAFLIPKEHIEEIDQFYGLFDAQGRLQIIVTYIRNESISFWRRGEGLKMSHPVSNDLTNKFFCNTNPQFELSADGQKLYFFNRIFCDGDVITESLSEKTITNGEVMVFSVETLDLLYSGNTFVQNLNTSLEGLVSPELLFNDPPVNRELHFTNELAYFFNGNQVEVIDWSQNLPVKSFQRSKEVVEDLVLMDKKGNYFELLNDSTLFKYLISDVTPGRVLLQTANDSVRYLEKIAMAGMQMNQLDDLDSLALLVQNSEADNATKWIFKENISAALYNEGLIQLEARDTAQACKCFLRADYLNSLEAENEEAVRRFCIGNSSQQIQEVQQAFYDKVLSKRPNYVIAADGDTIKIHPMQWHLEMAYLDSTIVNSHVSIREAWEYGMGEGVTVSILDYNYIDQNHREFSGNNKLRYSPQNPENGKSTNSLGDGSTMFAGLIAASGVEIAGIAPRAEFLQYYSDEPKYGEEYEKRIKALVEGGTDIIFIPASISIPTDFIGQSYADQQDYLRTAFEEFKRGLEYAMLQGRNGKGCILFAMVSESASNNLILDREENMFNTHAANIDPSGDAIYNPNDRFFWTSYPSGYLSTIFSVKNATAGLLTTISTTNNNAVKIDFGIDVEISDDYSFMLSSQSKAAAGLAGIAALILSINPDLYWYEVKEILRLASEPINPEAAQYDEDGHSIYFGYGKINAGLAARYAEYSKTNPIGVSPESLLSESSGELLTQQIANPQQQAQEDLPPTIRPNESYLADGKFAFNNQSYNEAISFFQQVAAPYDSQIWLEAQYWIAETQFAQEKYDACRDQCVVVRQNAQDSPLWYGKASLLLAESWVGKNNLYQARLILENFIQGNLGDAKTTKDAIKRLDELQTGN